MEKFAKRAKKASIHLATVPNKKKNEALQKIADVLDKNRNKILIANEKDIKRSKKEKLSEPLLKRLAFTDEKIDGVIEGIQGTIKLEDPVGAIQVETELDHELRLKRVAVPMGVIGVIFESRPDALVQIASLCLKSGNCVLLKGGSEASETNKILAKLIIEATKEVGIPKDWLFHMESREEVTAMLALDHYIDLIIPRGSNDFVRYIMEHSKIPVLGHADGICHTYVHKEADIEMALKVVVDAKTQYVTVCNATETLLVDKEIATEFLVLFQEKVGSKVTIYGDEETRKIIICEPATNMSWKTEYLDYEISIKVVEDEEEAIEHIQQYSSKHTEAIVTSNEEVATAFMDRVDAGNVFWNCSTRFADGFRYGFGAEVGISTNKIHARGPVGLEGLMTYKYKLYGNGQIVADYADGRKSFRHKRIK